jgi:hypothetical protein
MKTNKKKSQIQSQIFVYILSMVVIALVLLYGYNAIKGFKERQEQITLVELENQLKSLINSASPKYGSIEKGDIALPSEYNTICFVDNGELGSSDDCGLPEPDAAIVRDAIQSSTANIFLIPGGSKNFRIGNIKVEGGCVCIPKTGSNAVFRVEGLGNGVRISNWKNAQQ